MNGMVVRPTYQSTFEKKGLALADAVMKNQPQELQ